MLLHPGTNAREYFFQIISPRIVTASRLSVIVEESFQYHSYLGCSWWYSSLQHAPRNAVSHTKSYFPFDVASQGARSHSTFVHSFREIHLLVLFRTSFHFRLASPFLGLPYLPLLDTRSGLAFIAIDRMQLNLVRVVWRVDSITFAPIITNGIGKDRAVLVESGS